MKILHNPDGWSLDGDTIKSTRADSYLPLFRVEPLTPESDVRLVLAAPAMLAALKAILAQHDRPHGFDDSRWYAREVALVRETIDSAEGR